LVSKAIGVYLYSHFTQFINKDDIKSIIEIGCGNGLDSIELKEYYNCEVYPFECNPESIKVCEENLKGSGIELIKKAVSNIDGKIKFYPVTNGNFLASSIYKVNEDYQKYENLQQEEIEVESIRLDTWLREKKIKPDMLCMDVQGAILKVLEGMGEHIKDVTYILTEVGTKISYDCEPLIDEVKLFMDKNDFDLIQSYNAHQYFGDYLFKKRKTKIALTILAYNGEMYLPETIGNLLPFVDEVKVALDSRSNDNSREILKSFGSKVEFKEFKWDHHYSKAKNFMLKMVSKDTDWIIALSEDNKIKNEDCKKLVEFIKTISEDIGGICLPQKNHYPDWTDDEEHYIGWLYPNRHCCILRNFDTLRSEGRVHENYSNTIKAKGFNIINYDEVNRHHHAWRGEKDIISLKGHSGFGHKYYKALGQLPWDWTSGEELPKFSEDIPTEVIDYLGDKSGH
jgi:FkbM family methyltransferase